MKNIKRNIASALYEIGLSANAATALGLLFAGLSGLLIYQGYFFWASAALLISGGLDLLDGAIARVSKKASAFGGILDSSLDRYGDGFVLGGALFFCAAHGKTLYAGLAMSAMLGSFLISYVRARAECAIEKCKVGFWERGERTVFLALGLLFNNLAVVLWVLGVATHLTAAFRLAYASRPQDPRWSAPSSPWGIRNLILHTGGRQSPVYYAKVALLFLAVAFLRLPF